MTILITRPRYDPATNCLYYWTKPVVDLARKKSIDCVDLKSKKANKKLFLGYVKKIKPELIFINGHGSDSFITGDDSQILISTQDDLSIFSGCIFYCRSCNCALILGPALINAKTKGFIGYQRKFTVAYSSDNSHNLLHDPLAKLFLEPSNLVPMSLIKGNTLENSYNKSQAAMKSNLRKMLSSTASFEERYYAQYLWSNIKSQTVLGNPNSKI